MNKTRPNYEYGEKLLKQMGWSEGRGLGKNEDGMADFIKVKKKMNTKGMGFNGVDDRWIEHQEDFDSLLSKLNDGNPAASEEKLISVEKRAFKVGGRVHYSKFLRGKDLSQKKPEELDAIIVVKRRRKNVEAVPETVEAAEEELLSGVQTHTSSLSYQEYFAERMKASRRRRGLGEDGNEAHCQKAAEDTEYVDGHSTDVKSETKPERRSKRQNARNESGFKGYHESTDVDNLQAGGAEPMGDCAEHDVPRRTKKSKHKPSQDSGDPDQLAASDEGRGVVATGLEESFTPTENCYSVEDAPKRTKKKSKNKPSQDAVGADHLEANNDEPEHNNLVDAAFSEPGTDSCLEKRARKKSKRKRASDATIPDMTEEDNSELGNRAAEGEQPASDGELSRHAKKKSKPRQDAVGLDEPDVSHSATVECTAPKTKGKRKELRSVAEEVDANEEAASDLCLEERSSRRKKQRGKETAEVHAVKMEDAEIEPEVNVKKKSKPVQRIKEEPIEAIEEVHIKQEVKVKKEPKPKQKIKVEPAEEMEEAQTELKGKVKKESKPSRKVKVEPTEEMMEEAQVAPEVKVKKESKPSRKVKVEPTEEMEEAEIEAEVKVKKESKAARKIKVEPTEEMEEVQVAPEVKVKKESKRKQKIKLEPMEEAPRQTKSASLAKKKSEQKDKRKDVNASETADYNTEDCIPEASDPSSLPGNCKSSRKRSSLVSEGQLEEGEPSNKKRGIPDPAAPSRPVTRQSSSLALEAQAPQCSLQADSAFQGNGLKSEGPNVTFAPDNCGPSNGDKGVADNPADKPAFNPPSYPPNQYYKKRFALENVELQPWHQYEHHAVFQPGVQLPKIPQWLAEQFSSWFVAMVDKSIGQRLNPNKTCHLGKEAFAAALMEHIGWQHRQTNWIHIPGYGTNEWLHKSVGVLVNQMREEEQARRQKNLKEKKRVFANKTVWEDSDDED